MEEIPVQTDAKALAVFDGHRLSYTYEMGLAVTSVFKGADRHTEFHGEELSKSTGRSGASFTHGSDATTSGTGWP